VDVVEIVAGLLLTGVKRASPLRHLPDGGAGVHQTTSSLFFFVRAADTVVSAQENLSQIFPSSPFFFPSSLKICIVEGGRTQLLHRPLPPREPFVTRDSGYGLIIAASSLSFPPSPFLPLDR